MKASMGGRGEVCDLLCFPLFLTEVCFVHPAVPIFFNFTFKVILYFSPPLIPFPVSLHVII